VKIAVKHLLHVKSIEGVVTLMGQEVKSTPNKNVNDSPRANLRANRQQKGLQMISKTTYKLSAGCTRQQKKDT
jgi:hypothetical protein